MTVEQWRGMGFGVLVHAVRFGLIMGALWLAPLVGITGWYMGLFANAICSIYAVALITRYRLWKAVGIGRLWRGHTAALFLLVPLAESLAWILPDGLAFVPPGFGLWALTLLLVGFNEELISRGLVLNRLREGFGAFSAVILTGALFGLQHLSLFATSDRGAYDVLTNVIMSGTVGFAFAAYQYRFSWIWPLILLHAFADLTAIWARSPHGDLFAAGTAVMFVVYGVALLRGRTTELSGTASGTEVEPPMRRGAGSGHDTGRRSGSRRNGPSRQFPGNPPGYSTVNPMHGRISPSLGEGRNEQAD